MRIRLIIGAAITFLGTSFLFAPSTSNAETDPFPISYDTAFSDPILGLNTNTANMDQTAAYEQMRLIKCAYRIPYTEANPGPDGYVDPPGFCNGPPRDIRITQNIRIELAADRLNDVKNGKWDPTALANTESTLYAGLNALLKTGKAYGRMFYPGSSKDSGVKAIKAYIFNNKDGDTFVACKNAKGGTGCLSGARSSIMHVKTLSIEYEGTESELTGLAAEDGYYATRNQSGQPVKNAILHTSSNLGSRSFDQTFNNAVTVYNDDALMNGVDTAFERMATQNKASKSGTEGASSGSYYKPSSLWPTSAPGLFLGNDSVRNGGLDGASRATRFIFLPMQNVNNMERDPFMGILQQVVPDKSCEIRVMHNRFKTRRAILANKLAELSNNGCSVEIVAFKDDKGELGQPIQCGLGSPVRVCPPVLGLLTQGDGIKVYAAAVHDKTMMIKARFKDGNGELETLVQSGTASFTQYNIISSDEITTFYWDPEIYEEFREHWDIMLSRADTCAVNMSTGKLTGSTTYCNRSKYN